MKKWYIFLQMSNAVMIGSILAPIWIDEYYWFQLLPWISADKALPKEGEVVYIAFRDKTGFGVNVATFENGVFNSYSTNKPDYWMHVPVLPKVEEE